MNPDVIVHTAQAVQTFTSDEFPVPFGLGPHARVQLPYADAPVIVGHLNWHGDDLVFEPSGVEEIIHSHAQPRPAPPPPPPAPATETETDEDEDGDEKTAATVPPVPPPPPPRPPPPEYKHSQLLSRAALRPEDYLTVREHCRIEMGPLDGDGQHLHVRSKAVAGFRDVERKAGPQRRRSTAGTVAKLALLALLLFLVAAAAVGGWMLTGKRVSLEFAPAPDHSELSGGLLRPSLGGRFLLRPGDYRVTAELAGHHPIDEPITVSNTAEQVFHFDFRPLPGLVDIRTEPEVRAPLRVDGEDRGRVPARELALEIGDYEIAVAPERYLPAATNIAVEGYGRTQQVVLALTPRWADITVNSPVGATVLADGDVRGEAPLTFELFEGEHELVFTKPLFRPHRRTIEVVANTPMTLPAVELVPSPGVVKLSAEPAGAKVTVDETYRGDAPLEFEVDANEAHTLRVFKLGYSSATVAVRLGPEETTNIVVKLEPQTGVIRISVDPSDADLFVNGTPRGRAEGAKVLPALPQELELRREGFEPFEKTMTPTPGFEQELTVALRPVRPPAGSGPTPGTGPAVANPESYATADKYTFHKIRPGAYTMGSGRSEQGAPLQRDAARHRAQTPFLPRRNRSDRGPVPPVRRGPRQRRLGRQRAQRPPATGGEPKLGAGRRLLQLAEPAGGTPARLPQGRRGPRPRRAGRHRLPPAHRSRMGVLRPLQGPRRHHPQVSLGRPLPAQPRQRQLRGQRGREHRRQPPRRPHRRPYRERPGRAVSGQRAQTARPRRQRLRMVQRRLPDPPAPAVRRRWIPSGSGRATCTSSAARPGATPASATSAACTAATGPTDSPISASEWPATWSDGRPRLRLPPGGLEFSLRVPIGEDMPAHPADHHTECDGYYARGPGPPGGRRDSSKPVVQPRRRRGRNHRWPPNRRGAPEGRRGQGPGTAWVQHVSPPPPGLSWCGRFPVVPPPPFGGAAPPATVSPPSGRPWNSGLRVPIGEDMPAHPADHHTECDGYYARGPGPPGGRRDRQAGGAAPPKAWAEPPAAPQPPWSPGGAAGTGACWEAGISAPLRATTETRPSSQAHCGIVLHNSVRTV